MSFDHHAYLVLGSREAGERFVLDLLKEEGVALENNPDLHFFREQALSIDEARKLRTRAERRSFGEKSVFVILSERIGREAQNALLKTLEEPPEGTHIFIVAAHEDLLLPTLRSRMQRVRIPSPPAKGEPEGVRPLQASPSQGKRNSFDPESFLALAPVKRIAFAKKFVDAERPLGPFLDALLLSIRPTAKPDVLKKVFDLRRYADDQSANARMIIEHLAFLC